MFGYGKEKKLLLRIKIKIKIIVVANVGDEKREEQLLMRSTEKKNNTYLG
jgi:hypothetical protein